MMTEKYKREKATTNICVVQCCCLNKKKWTIMEYNIQHKG